MFDAHIVGGGPAGCICGRELARKGLKVLVSEEHLRVGVPVQCSGLISVEGLDSLGIDYSKTVLNKAKGARVYSPGMNSIIVGNGEVRACVVDRAALDSLLAEKAQAEGVQIETGKRLKKHELNGKMVVGADGAGSSVASWFGFPAISEFAVCMQAEFEGAHIEDTSHIEMFLSNERFPGFFGWIIPVERDSARVGVGAYSNLASKEKKPVKALYESFISSKLVKERLAGAKEGARIGGIIPMKPRWETAKGNVLLVGDAAGQTKATTGGGVAFGSAAAKISAECIANGEVTGYDAKWRSELGQDLNLHCRLRAFLNSLSDQRMNALFTAAKTFGAESFLNQFGDMDKPSKMIDRLKKGRYGLLYSAYSALLKGF